ncbi:MAG: glycoside hydrolase family 3 N-terminal domain-containing protein [Alphaproteobacteria bacterium]|nr:glycoside hydrolase family 3 N-terminal domain-containing protein [Alphaproteobacteria bacterium]
MSQAPILPVVFGCAGLALTREERDFFRQSNPLGLIVFDRNVQNPAQLKRLIADFRDAVGRKNAPVLVDQEGGRVQRLWPPYWHGLPWARTYGDIYPDNPKKALKMVRGHAETMAKDLRSVGLNVVCWPCLDVAVPETHDIMAKRCFSDDAGIVATLGRAAVQGALKNGVMPVVKHIPGYGRTIVDPHARLPVVRAKRSVLEKSDFAPFRGIAEPVWGMTAHVVYEALDKKRPATLSPVVVGYIREQIGFGGFLVSDDICMGALGAFGTPVQIAQACIAAGCDAVLHCNGDLAEMKRIARGLAPMSGESLARLGSKYVV